MSSHVSTGAFVLSFSLHFLASVCHKNPSQRSPKGSSSTLIFSWLICTTKKDEKIRNYCISKQLFYWWLDNPTVQSFTEFCLIQSRILAILQISKMHFRECTINFLLLMRSLRFNLISFIKFLPSRFLIHRARKWKSSWLNKEPFNKFQIQKFENE